MPLLLLRNQYCRPSSVLHCRNNTGPLKWMDIQRERPSRDARMYWRNSCPTHALETAKTPRRGISSGMARSERHKCSSSVSDYTIIPSQATDHDRLLYGEYYQRHPSYVGEDERCGRGLHSPARLHVVTVFIRCEETSTGYLQPFRQPVKKAPCANCLHETTAS